MKRAPIHRRLALTVREAASLAGVGEHTMREWVKAGHFNTLRVGTQIRVSRKSVEVFINGHTVPSPSVRAG
jgi:excisionase family DNA binding protein